MSDTNRIGPIVDTSMVEQAVLKYVKAALPYYVADQERIRGLAPQTIPLPQEWFTSQDTYAPDANGKMPVLIVTSPGQQGKGPIYDGSGAATTPWKMSIAIYAVTTKSAQTVGRNIRIYSACVQAMLVQDETLNQDVLTIDGVDLGAAKFNSKASSTSQTMGLAEVPFIITVRNVFSKFGTIIDYTSDPYADPGAWPEATSVSYTVAPKEEESDG